MPLISTSISISCTNIDTYPSISTHRNTRKPTPFIVRCGGDLHAKGESTGFMYLSGWRGQL